MPRFSLRISDESAQHNIEFNPKIVIKYKSNLEPIYIVNIQNLSVNDISLVTLDTKSHNKYRDKIQFPDHVLGESEEEWISKGDNKNVERCFFIVKEEEPYGAIYFGYSNFRVNHIDPNECYVHGRVVSEDLVSAFLGIAVYCDLLEKACSNLFLDPHIIYNLQREDLETEDAIRKAGWEPLNTEYKLYEELTLNQPNPANYPRFTVQNDRILERNHNQNPDGSYNYEPTKLYCHMIGQSLEYNLEALE